MNIDDWNLPWNSGSMYSDNIGLQIDLVQKRERRQKDTQGLFVELPRWMMQGDEWKSEYLIKLITRI